MIQIEAVFCAAAPRARLLSINMAVEPLAMCYHGSG
jgi:hypothetical protein